MRCKECGAQNDEGAAICGTCGAPLTAYAGQVTGVVSAATRAKVARLAVRPPAVAVLTALDLLAVVVWPLRVAAAAVLGRTQLNAEGTNYVGAAFGALGTVMTLVVMGIIALLLLLLAWGTWTQRTWAWWVNTIALGLVVLGGIIAYPGALLRGVLQVGLAGTLAYFWLRSEVREWYGVR